MSRKKFPSSIESLARRAAKGGDPFTIHPLVDFYNAVSLRHLVPAGGFDLDHLDGDLELTTTAGGEPFLALDSDTPEEVEAGEMAYRAGGRVLTRHLVWRQSRHALLRPETRRLVLVSEVLAPLPEDLAGVVDRDLSEGLERYFGASTGSAILDQRRPAFALATG